MTLPGRHHNILQAFPEELLQAVIDRLDRHALASLSLASKWSYSIATPKLWAEVELKDCRTMRGFNFDDHDDTPLIKKLLVLATNPWLASCVRVLTHRCHLPPPSLHNELPETSFNSQTLSIDPRTIRLTQLATQRMNRLHSLRIIFGHPTLNDALLRCLFDINRNYVDPVRKLWLENCRISVGCQLRREDHKYGLPTELSFEGLESLRLRRMPLQYGTAAEDVVPAEYTYARSHPFLQTREDGRGGHYKTSACPHSHDKATILQMISDPAGMKAFVDSGRIGKGPGRRRSSCAFGTIFGKVFAWDDQIYKKLAPYLTLDQRLAIDSCQLPTSDYERGVLALRGVRLDPIETEPASPFAREQIPTFTVALGLLQDCAQSLTSLTLDWLFTNPEVQPQTTNAAKYHQRWLEKFMELFSLRFPQLRAFQLRSALDERTLPPSELCMFDQMDLHVEMEDASAVEGPGVVQGRSTVIRRIGCLDFVEAHPNLQCLAWPMAHFFPTGGTSVGNASRVHAVIDNLGHKLIELRVDDIHNEDDNTFVDDDPGIEKVAAMTRRRRFIERFVSKMRRLEVIKIEGGVPREERREVLRALHGCPLRKIVTIDACCTLGNTWDEESDKWMWLPLAQQRRLKREDKETVWALGTVKPTPPDREEQFRADYSWSTSPPMVSVIAAYHSSTVTELKFAGYIGAPELLSPTAITTPMLSGLKYFNNLKRLTMSFHLDTTFESEPCDEQIISYWQDCRSPSSTALVSISDDAPGAWATLLSTVYEPTALAERLVVFLAPFLSEEAKSRPGGIEIRASFCVGVDRVRDVFDLDLRLEKDEIGRDVALDVVGPRPEIEPERRKSKLDSRGWF